MPDLPLCHFSFTTFSLFPSLSLSHFWHFLYYISSVTVFNWSCILYSLFFIRLWPLFNFYATPPFSSHHRPPPPHPPPRFLPLFPIPSFFSLAAALLTYGDKYIYIHTFCTTRLRHQGRFSDPSLIHLCTILFFQLICIIFSPSPSPTKKNKIPWFEFRSFNLFPEFICILFFWLSSFFSIFCFCTSTVCVCVGGTDSVQIVSSVLRWEAF